MAVEGHDTASVGLAVGEARWLVAITVGVMLFAFACATELEPDDASQLMAAAVTPSTEVSDTPLASQPTETPAPVVVAVLPTLTPQPTRPSSGSRTGPQSNRRDGGLDHGPMGAAGEQRYGSGRTVRGDTGRVSRPRRAQLRIGDDVHRRRAQSGHRVQIPREGYWRRRNRRSGDRYRGVYAGVANAGADPDTATDDSGRGAHTSANRY